MIWFGCKKCGKVHGRPETSAGATVFCDCGVGLLVPWESNAAEPDAPPVLDAPEVPKLAPMTFTPPAATASSLPPDEEDRPRRARERRDPDYCFNHQRLPRSASCVDCGEAFCEMCLVSFEGKTMCGPCKNFRARRLELPPAQSALASASLVVAILATPLALCTLAWGSPGSGLRVVSLVSLLPQAVALALGVWALWSAEREGKTAGQALAITGIATAGVMSVLTLLLNFYAARPLA